MTAYTSKTLVVCPDSRVRTADVHFSKMYGRDRYSVRVKGKRVTGDALPVDGHPDVMCSVPGVKMAFTPDPYSMNSDLFN